ncbi:hypothetical protein [Vibrio sp. TRT 17S01]|uniref:hypothetical protein n=1 Tax=Vibrio sp. TRT 17S01 TaxID=3418505 RepID=UPI003CF34DF2
MKTSNKIRTVLLLPALALSLSASAQPVKPYSLASDVTCIESAYSMIEKNDDVARNQERFYQCFPKNFDRFFAIFGYSETDSGTDGLLAGNEKSYDYLDQFFKLTVSKNQYSNMFQLGVNGHWQIDNVAYLQYLIRKFLTSYQNTAIEELNRLADRELKSFWFFYFDSQIKLKSVPDEVISIKDKNARVYGFALNEFNKMFKD